MSSLRLDPLDSFGDADEALATYVGMDSAAFGWPADPEQLAAKAEIVDPSRYLLARWDDEPVGGSGSYAFELTLPGGALVPAAGVSDVGVLPTHRRRGVLSALLRRQLGSLAASGTPVALLHASEAGIYRRFGFGPATKWRQVRIDTRRVRLLDSAPRAAGTVHVVDRGHAAEDCAQVHDRVRRSVPGGLSRPAPWWPVVFGDTDVYLGGTKDHLVLLHRDPDGGADGYAIYTVVHDWSSGQAQHELKVWELVGVEHSVELDLWRTLVEHDLVATVTGPIAVDHPLFDVAVDARQVGTDWEQDLLWARPLDVPALLSARTYGEPGRVVFDLEDRLLPELSGTYELVVGDDGAGECRRCDATPMARLDVADLGSVLLGGASWRRLARAGRIHAAEATLETADRLFAVDPLPWCWVRF